MKIVAAGATGFLGEPLVKRLQSNGHDVAVLTRNPDRVRAGRGLRWDAKTPDGAWVDEVATADVVINLTGENVGEGRWSDERKRRLIDSRVQSTGALIAAMNRRREHARTFISASAVGYYGFDRGDQLFDESGTRGRGFLAELVEQWEAATRAAEPLARVVLLRFGVALGPDGGALRKMIVPFRFGVGGPIGDGRQWLSWVDRDDVVRAIEWAMERETARGIYNVTSPTPVRNREFASTVGRVLHRPSFMPTPAFALRLALGEMADEILLGGQRVVPSRLQAAGFQFEHPELEGALRRIVGGS